MGVEDPDILTSINNLAHTSKSQGNLQNALTLMEQCSNLRNRVIGHSHPYSMSSACALNDWMGEYNALIASHERPVQGWVTRYAYFRGSEQYILQVWIEARFGSIRQRWRPFSKVFHSCSHSFWIRLRINPFSRDRKC